MSRGTFIDCYVIDGSCHREDIDVSEPDDTGASSLAIAQNTLENNVYMRMVMISMRDSIDVMVS